MFNLLTIITLLLPAVLVPVMCLAGLWAIDRTEASRKAPRPVAPATRLRLDAATAPLAPEPVRERHVA